MAPCRYIEFSPSFILSVRGCYFINRIASMQIYSHQTENETDHHTIMNVNFVQSRTHVSIVQSYKILRK